MSLYDSEETRERGFSVVIDMRGGTWTSVKPILKILNEHFSSVVFIVYIIKPDNFWQKQRTSLASHKYKFEVKSVINSVFTVNQWADYCILCFLFAFSSDVHGWCRLPVKSY